MDELVGCDSGVRQRQSVGRSEIASLQGLTQWLYDILRTEKATCNTLCLFVGGIGRRSFVVASLTLDDDLETAARGCWCFVTAHIQVLVGVASTQLDAHALRFVLVALVDLQFLAHLALEVN